MKNKPASPRALTPYEQFALELFDKKIFLDKRYSPTGLGWVIKLHETNPDAPLSPYYFNFRTPQHPTNPGELTPELTARLGAMLFQLARSEGIEYEFVAGIPHAGDPLAEWFVEAAHRSGLRPGRVFLQKETNGEFTVRSVEGRTPQSDDRVILIDDVISRGRTKNKVVCALERGRCQFRVAGIATIIDCEEFGAESLHRNNYRACTLYKIADLSELYAVTGRLPKTTYWDIRNYISQRRFDCDVV